jgi:hypothetical protein
VQARLDADQRQQWAYLRRTAAGPAAWYGGDNWQEIEVDCVDLHGDELRSVMGDKIRTLQLECDLAAAGPKDKARAKQIRGDVDPSTLPFELPTAEKHCRQVNQRAESTEELRRKPMPASYTIPVTDHVPIPHFLLQQLRRAATLGLVEMHVDKNGRWTATNGTEKVLEQGPTPFPDFKAKNYTGPPPPADPADLFEDPATWKRITEWYRRYCLEIERAEKGYQFNVNRIPGGQSGLRIPASATKPEWRHLVWNLQGLTPYMVTPTLPDHNSTVDLYKVYRDAMAAGICDKEIVSMLALFGVQAKCTMSMDTVLIPNYKKAWEHLLELQKAYDKKRSGFEKPRVSAEMPQPHHHPTRLLPKGCVRQEKDDGRVKYREAQPRHNLSDEKKMDNERHQHPPGTSPP